MVEQKNGHPNRLQGYALGPLHDEAAKNQLDVASTSCDKLVSPVVQVHDDTNRTTVEQSSLGSTPASKLFDHHPIHEQSDLARCSWRTVVHHTIERISFGTERLR